MEALDAVMEKAKTTFASEDGWVVINLARLEDILKEVEVTA